MRVQKSLVDSDGQAAERMLEPLIEQYGITGVLETLAKLIPIGKFETYQRVAALARNVNNRIERRKWEVQPKC